MQKKAFCQKKDCTFAVEMKTRILIVILLTGMLLNANAQQFDPNQFAYNFVSAQYIRIVGNPQRCALYFDMDRLYNFNLYERSRWGGGLHLVWNTNGQILRQLTADGYAGYGTYDKRWKWGGRVDLLWNERHQPHLYVAYIDDLAAVASRTLESYQLFNFSNNSHFMSRRFHHVRRATAGWQWTAWKKLTINIEGRISAEQRLYHSVNTFSSDLIYPSRFHSDNVFHEFRIALQHSSGWRGETTTGIGGEYFFTRTIGQYAHTFRPGPFNLSVFSQAGIVLSLKDGQTPYSRMFDLGGSWNSSYCFQRTLLTASPNEFTAEAFGFLSLRLSLRKPLYEVFSDLFQLGSSPRPFIQMVAAWGTLWNHDANGQRQVELGSFDNLTLQAPNLGILEPAIGIDGLIRWGITDWGVAAAYRLTPTTAAYHRASPRDNLALMVSLTLHP